MSATLADVLARLPRARKVTGGYMAPCPAHPDKRPSLSITTGLDGQVLLHCFAGCTYREVVAALGLTGTPPTGVPTDPIDTLLWDAMRQAGRRKDVRVRYALADAHRTLVQRIARLHAAAQDLPPGLEATWEMLATAQRLEDERRLIAECLDRWDETDQQTG